MIVSFRLSGRTGYSDDEINVIFKPYSADMYRAGDYEGGSISDPRKEKIQFPGTNYPLYEANNGRSYWI